MFKPADVVFVMHENNKLSKIIAWFMRSKWSHSALVSTIIFNRWFLTETSDVQVYGNFLDKYLNDPECSVMVLRDPNLTEQEREDIGKASTKQYGILFGFIQLPAFAIREIIFRIFKKQVKPFWQSGQVCCHVISYAFRDALGNSHFLGRIEPESFHTEELYQMLLRNGFQIVFEKKGIKK